MLVKDTYLSWNGYSVVDSNRYKNRKYWEGKYLKKLYNIAKQVNKPIENDNIYIYIFPN